MREHTYVPLQPWTCDKCGARGDVEAPAGQDVVERVSRVCQDHDKKSPDCARLTLGSHLRFGQIALHLPD